MRLLLILLMTALFGMALSALTAPEPAPILPNQPLGIQLIGNYESNKPVGVLCDCVGDRAFSSTCMYFPSGPDRNIRTCLRCGKRMP